MGAQIPRIHVSPVEKPDRSAFQALEMLNDYGFVFDEWQELVITDWLSRDSHGKYLAKLCGLSIPRQNGKTWTLLGRALIGILLFDEVVLWTAHEVKTARNAFLDMAALFADDGPFPDLADQVEYIRRANGQEEIKLKDYVENGVLHVGGRVIFSARSRGAARGFTVDCLILDEAQELSAEQYAALMPTISSGRNQNSQVIMCGTPPDKIGRGEIFFNTRKAALGDDPGSTSWIEWSIDAIPDDPFAWEHVEATNPALGIRLMDDVIKAEQKSMPVDYYCRERLSLWPKEFKAEETIINSLIWQRIVMEDFDADGAKIVYGVKFDPSGSRYAVCVAAMQAGGIPHVELLKYDETNGSIDELVAFLNARADKGSYIAVDGKAYSGGLVFALTNKQVGGRWRKAAVHELKTSEMITAASMFLSTVIGEALTHTPNEALDDSVTHATKRLIGSKESGAWGFGAAAEHDATPCEAAVIAHWAVKTSRLVPKKQTVVF